MRVRRWLKRGGIAILALVLLFALLMAGLNRTLPSQSVVVDRLGEAEKARLLEFAQLRRQLGDTAWPGWSSSDIPLLVYNEQYAFLVGYPHPPDGWLKVPNNARRGGPWELVPNDSWADQPYYRQRLPESGETPEAFTVRVGDRWAASMPTMAWMEISLREQLRKQLPPFLDPVFPYWFMSGLFIRGSDGYISLLAHEAFHAYQGQVAPENLAAAENIVGRADGYPRQDVAFEEAWQQELELLADALQAESTADAVILSQQFLAQRAQRRQVARLDATLVDYERRREWLEGLGRYVELALWREASLADDYQAVEALSTDPDFDNYAGYRQRWTQEIDQMRRMAGDGGDGRFYYSGMGQAMLLDRLAPGWKAGALASDVYLEVLLATAVAEPSP